MRVRHKLLGTTTEADPTEGGFLIRSLSMYLPASHWEEDRPPIPEERWINVTAECRADEDGKLYQSHSTFSPLICANNGYRIRKVELFDLRREPSHYLISVKAFIIEQKERA